MVWFRQISLYNLDNNILTVNIVFHLNRKTGDIETDPHLIEMELRYLLENLTSPWNFIGFLGWEVCLHGIQQSYKATPNYGLSSYQTRAQKHCESRVLLNYPP